MVLNHTLNRWVVYPTSGGTACLGLSMAPGSPAKLEEAVKVMKKNLQDTTILVCAVKLTKGGKYTALEVPMWPTPASRTETLQGMGDNSPNPEPGRGQDRLRGDQEGALHFPEQVQG